MKTENITPKTAISILNSARPRKGSYGRLQVAFDMAVKALEKQIPKKPKEYEDRFYGCPNCANPLMHKWEKYPSVLMSNSQGLPYCLNCGQALDWSE